MEIQGQFDKSKWYDISVQSNKQQQQQNLSGI